MSKAWSTNINLSQTPEIDEKKDPKVYSELLRLRAAVLVLQDALDVYTGALGETDPTYYSQTPVTKFTRLQNISRVYLQTTEAIGAGKVVNLYNSGGVLKVRNATAAFSLTAHAYAISAVANGAWGEFFLMGVVPSTGLTIGSTYYLANPSGGISTSAGAPLSQKIGWAMSTTQLFFRPDLV